MKLKSVLKRLWALAAILCLLMTCVPLAAFAEGEQTPEFEIPEDAPYVYFTVWDKNGKKAHTHAFTREEFSR